MLRSEMRDEIRATAEMPGASVMTGLLNLVIQETLNALTSLAKYDQCFTIGTSLAIAANGIVTLPTNLQHFDDSEVYFLIDGSTDLGNKYYLQRYSKARNKTIGRANQFRFFGTDTAGAVIRKLAITPFDEISTADDRVLINHWRTLPWTTDSTTFPLPLLQEVMVLRAAARICKSTNSKLAAALRIQARDAYIAMRAGQTVY